VIWVVLRGGADAMKACASVLMLLGAGCFMDLMGLIPVVAVARINN